MVPQAAAAAAAATAATVRQSSLVRGSNSDSSYTAYREFNHPERQHQRETVHAKLAAQFLFCNVRFGSRACTELREPASEIVVLLLIYLSPQLTEALKLR